MPRVRSLVIRLGIATRDGQVTILLVLVCASVLVMIGSLSEYERAPISTFFLPLLGGSILLRFWPLLVLVVVDAACVTGILGVEGMETARTTVVVILAVFAVTILMAAARRRGSLPALMGESMLIDLRDRLRSQGELPDLPRGWYAESALRSAEGAQFAGDFLVATRTHEFRNLEIVVVDVSGKGLAAGTRALQLSGAFGGLLGALPAEQFLPASNAYLLRQDWSEGFATAIHLVADLDTGDFVVRTAGHPPALQWRAGAGKWLVHHSAGPALGLIADPVYEERIGRLNQGDALLLYTDGMVETSQRDFTMGIDRLIGQADRIVTR
ncbi:MAG: PP2C family protein-serine/threonine phosphatase, partial [Streptosporangiaceae bacterium]